MPRASPPRSPLLCDAVVVIEAHAVGVWELLIQRCPVAVPGTVIEESQFYQDPMTERRMPVRLRGAVEAQTIERLDATAEEIDAVRLVLDRVTVEGLHAGELEAPALLHTRNLPHRFCTADETATRALCHLGLHDRGVSFEQVLRECGLTKTLRPHFGDAVFQRWKSGGVIEWIQRRDRPTPG